MRKVWCKIWNFILMLFQDVVDIVVASAERTVGIFADIVDVIVGGVTDLVDNVSPMNKLLLVGGIGFILYLLLTNKDEQHGGKQSVDNAAVLGPGSESSSY